jgi:CheY-like chemotaxis protein
MSESKTVLVVDDDRYNLEILSAMLELRDYEVDTASNGSEALDCFEKKHYDLILMDIMMPELNGNVATQIIRALEKPEDEPTRIIAVTAKDPDGNREIWQDSGFNGYLTKPFSEESLWRTLDSTDRYEVPVGYKKSMDAEY